MTCSISDFMRKYCILQLLKSLMIILGCFDDYEDNSDRLLDSFDLYSHCK